MGPALQALVGAGRALPPSGPAGPGIRERQASGPGGQVQRGSEDLAQAGQAVPLRALKHHRHLSNSNNTCVSHA